jgi:glutamate carboxypeptidase
MTVQPAARVPAAGAVRDQDLDDLIRWLAARREEMVDDLAAYVGHETPSTDKRLLDDGLDWITGWITDRLAVAPSVRRVGCDSYGDVALLDLPAQPPSVPQTAEPPLLFLCHYDTVWDAGTLAAWPFSRDGDTVTGPGAFDMKAGLVQGIWALRALEALGLARPAVRILLNGDEEVGSKGSRPIIEQAAEDAGAVLVLEPSAEAAVKTARKGVGIFELDVFGVEAHAGLDPTNGASAIGELARLVLHVHNLADLSAGTSVNVGTIRGGSRTNVIAGHAHATVDVRVTSAAEARRIDEGLAALAPSEPRLNVVLGGGWNRPVMERTPGVAAMFGLARQLAGRLGFDLDEIAAGGGSDANFITGRGIPVLDGLGPVGAGAHSRGEWVDVAAMPARAALAAALVHAFKAGNAGMPSAAGDVEEQKQ